MLDRLMRDHVIMREKAELLLQLLDAPAMPPAHVLSGCRWQLSSHIMQHLAFEDRHLYAKLLRDDRAHVLETGKRFQSELAELFGGYAEHAQFWTAERIASDWDGYRISARAKIQEMSERIDREESELFPLVCEADIDIASHIAPTTNWARDAFAIKDAMTGARRQAAG